MIQRNQPALRDKTHNGPKEKRNVIGKRRREGRGTEDGKGHVNSQVQLQDPVYECEQF